MTSNIYYHRVLEIDAIYNQGGSFSKSWSRIKEMSEEIISQRDVSLYEDQFFIAQRINSLEHKFSPSLASWFSSKIRYLVDVYIFENDSQQYLGLEENDLDLLDCIRKVYSRKFLEEFFPLGFKPEQKTFIFENLWKLIARNDQLELWIPLVQKICSLSE